MELISALSILLFVGVLTWVFFPRHRNLPPGPYPFPIIGNLYQLGKNPHRTFTKLSKTYGPLMSLHLGGVYTIVVSSPEKAKEILLKHGQAFSSRLVPAALQAHGHDKISLAFLPIGKEWLKFRKLGKEEMFFNSRLDRSQPHRQRKLQQLCEYVGKCGERGRPVNIGEAIFITALNLMSETLFSTEVTSYDNSEGSTQDFKTIMGNIVDLTGKANMADYFPILKPFDPQGIKRKADIYFGRLLDLIEGLINQRLESRRRAEEKKKTDFLETLLDLQEDGSNEYDLNIEFMKHFLLDMFVGGSETTSSSVEWAMTELLLNPEILQKAKQEIKSAVGNNKVLNETDILQLPYLQAVIKENLRYHPPGPFLIPRKAEFEAHVSGYLIPKETQVIVNVWGMGRDPTIWSDPESFEPERFLIDNNKSNNIDFKGQDFELIPFGAGRRLCPGMPLANRMMHITVATLIHNFDWKLVEDGQDHRADVFGIALRKAVPLMAIPIKPNGSN